MSSRGRLVLQDILNKAAELADRSGVEAVTLAALAKELHIRPPSLYNHVDGLPGLRKKLALYGAEKLYQVLSEATIGRAKDEAVYSLGEAYLAFARKHPGLYELTLSAPDQEDTELQAVAEKIIALLLQVLKGYGLEDEPALHVVRGLRSIIHGFASLEQKEGFKLELDRDTSYRLLLKTYLAGLQTLETKERI